MCGVVARLKYFRIVLVANWKVGSSRPPLRKYATSFSSEKHRHERAAPRESVYVHAARTMHTPLHSHTRLYNLQRPRNRGKYANEHRRGQIAEKKEGRRQRGTPTSSVTPLRTRPRRTAPRPPPRSCFADSPCVSAYARARARTPPRVLIYRIKYTIHYSF